MCFIETWKEGSISNYENEAFIQIPHQFQEIEIESLSPLMLTYFYYGIDQLNENLRIIIHKSWRRWAYKSGNI